MVHTPMARASTAGGTTAGRTPRPATRGRRASWSAAVAVWGLFAGYRVWRTVAGPAWMWQDSASYVAVSRHRIFSLAFLAGRRAPLVPLVWKLAASPATFVVAQTVIAVAAWTLLAATVATTVRAGWPALVAAAATLGFASCWQVLEWDWSVLSESLSLSAVAVIASATIWLLRRFSLPRAAVLVAACALYEAARDQAIWSVGLAAAGLVAYAAVRAATRARPGAARHALGLGLVLLATAGLGEVGAAHAGRNIVNVEDVFVVRVFPDPPRVAWFARHGMPQSGAVEVLARATHAPPGQAKVVAPDLTSPFWAPLARWFAAHSELAYIHFLATHPLYDLTAPLHRPALTYNNADGNLAFYGDIHNHTRNFLPVLPDVFFPPWQTEAAIAIAALTLLARRGRQPPHLIASLATIALTGTLSALIAWNGDGMEIVRHTIEGNVQTRLAILIAALAALLPPPDTRDEPAPAHSLRRPPHDTDPSQPD